MIVFSCRSEHEGVDDEYSRGFFNAMAIVEGRGLLIESDSLKWPYWDECKRSYLSKQDLYNHIDSSYLK